MTMTQSNSSLRPIRNALLIAALFLGLSAALQSLSPERLSEEWVHRLSGVMSGGVVVYFSNAVSKSLTPLARLRDPVAEQAIRRFSAWTLTLGGVGYALASLVAPARWANEIAVVLLASATMLVIGRWAVAYGRCLRRRAGEAQA
jgi:hypothetical protein